MKPYLAIILLLCTSSIGIEKVTANPDPFKRILQGNNSDNKIILGYADLGANGAGGSDRIIGNRRNNIINGGSGNDNIEAHDGDDFITPGKGRDKVQGGEGVDTVIYEDKLYANTNIRTLSHMNLVNIDNEDVLIDIEFIQFADVKIEVKTLYDN